MQFFRNLKLRVKLLLVMALNILPVMLIGVVTALKWGQPSVTYGLVGISILLLLVSFHFINQAAIALSQRK
ncbi:hypothetical protein KAR50_06375 [Periweissella fabaria]|uniref:Uncharacterized protein n=1 Tax=Periweissella fabaria TaxID=546157 RepID=A0ABM8Z4A2_9LACO|nr:hypothetical protein [Periweissella fabaria]MCM0597468.1 hypothetical protein [Periweissella fabaria]CAH0416028.1 hypothetical protein WFA24289_00327 [Periweissella fabaria]